MSMDIGMGVVMGTHWRALYHIQSVPLSFNVNLYVKAGLIALRRVQYQDTISQGLKLQFYIGYIICFFQ